jgi:COMPASS component SWD3
VHEDNAGVTNVKFSPNGKYVLAWTLDGCIRLWDYVKGVCMKTYQGHRNIRWSVGGAFGVCGDEAFIVSGSEDGRICIWDAKSKAILQEIEDAHDGPVMWVDTHPTLDRLVSCGLDGTLRVWVHVDEEDEKLEDDVMDIAEDEKDDMIRDRNADDVDEVDAEIKEDLIKMEADEIMKDDLDDLDEI